MVNKGKSTWKGSWRGATGSRPSLSEQGKDVLGVVILKGHCGWMPPEVGVRSSLGERWWWLRRVVAGGVGEMIGLGTLEVERARFANRSVLG